MDLPKCFHNTKLRRLWFTLASHFGVASTLQRHPTFPHFRHSESTALAGWYVRFQHCVQKITFHLRTTLYLKNVIPLHKIDFVYLLKNLCHFFSLFEGRGRGRQHIYARLGTGCRDLQCCYQLRGEGKDTADAFAFDVLRLLGVVASETGRNPKKTRFFNQ